MYHSRPTDLVIRRIAVGLQNAFELSQKPLRPIASTAQAEIEHRASSGATILPEVAVTRWSITLKLRRFKTGSTRTKHGL
jgi:hypothetical protein